jgi:hypothetical protein
MPRWIPVLKVGHFTGGNGVEIDFDTARLDRIASKYNAELCETPLVIGHPKTDDPAFGWVEKFKRVGNVLMALPTKLVAEFAEAVNNGRYQYVSCKVRPDDTIGHIGFLGAVAPAVKGLGIVTLSAAGDDGVSVELSQADLWAEKSLFRRMLTFVQNFRDQVVAEKGVEAGDKLISNDEIGYFQADIDNLEQDTPTNTVTSLSEETIMDPKEHKRLMDEAVASATLAANARIAELSESLTKVTGERDQVTTNFTALQASVAKKDLDARTAEFSESCDAAIKAGKLPAGEKAATMVIMESLFQAGSVELSEADGKKSQMSPLEHLKKLLSLAKPSVEFTEHATQDRVGQTTELSDAAELSEAISKYVEAEAKLGHAVTVVDALQHVKEART